MLSSIHYLGNRKFRRCVFYILTQQNKEERLFGAASVDIRFISTLKSREFLIICNEIPIKLSFLFHLQLCQLL